MKFALIIFVFFNLNLLWGCSVQKSSLTIIEDKIASNELLPLENNSQKYWSFNRVKVSGGNYTSCTIDRNIVAELVFGDTLKITMGEKSDADIFHLHAVANALFIFQKYKIYKYKENVNLNQKELENFIMYKIYYKNDSLTYVFNTDRMSGKLMNMDYLLIKKAFYCFK